MADAATKDLTEFTTPLVNDVLPIDDLTANTTKKITKQNLVGGSIALASNFTTSSTSAVSITNLTFAIAANEIYSVEVWGTCSKASSSTGLKFQVSAPTGCTVAGVQHGGGATLAATTVASLITAINTLGTACATGTGVQVSFILQFRVVNSSTAGNIQISCATVTSNTLTIYAGTYMVFRKCTNV